LPRTSNDQWLLFAQNKMGVVPPPERPRFILTKNSSAGFSAPAMPILEFTEIGRHHPPPQLLFVRMFRPISLPKGQI